MRTVKAGFTPKDYEYNNLSTEIYSKEKRTGIMSKVWEAA